MRERVNITGRLVRDSQISAGEMRLAGRVSGALFILVGLTLGSFPLLPGRLKLDLPVVSALAAGAVLWGMAQLWLISWQRMPRWSVHCSGLLTLAMIAAAMAATGGLQSSAWIYLFFVVLFSAYFFGRTIAWGYIAGALLVQALPLVYSAAISHSNFFYRLVISAPAYPTFGAAIMAGKEGLARLQRRAEALAARQSALRRVATAVVGGEPVARLYEMVAREVALLHHVAAAGILRLSADGNATMMGSWPEMPGDGDAYRPGTVLPVPAGSSIDRLLRDGGSIRIDEEPPGSRARELGYQSSIVTPIRVGGEVWGVLAVTAAERGDFGAADEINLKEFAELLATALVSIEDRSRLAARASSDPLTGLANHRTLRERLGGEVSRSVRHELPLAVAVIDLDHFKLVNDIGGHAAGDAMLVRLAQSLQHLARSEDVLGRIGGDEFAWVMPQTDAEQALMAVERVRALFSRQGRGEERVTLSAGVCDLTKTSEPGELLRLADGALYWSKVHGRDQCWVYDAAVMDELSVQERAEHLERSQALLGLRALARAIDAKDAATRQHSERVSWLAGRLAEAAGWPEESVQLLLEAALVHDVGKIGVPDALLCKTSVLTEGERRQVVEHAELSARIVDGVLSAEQVSWIRMHHERPDGLGYPDGVAAADIPVGAGLLSVADAFDVMTVSRPYSRPKSPADAVAEIVSLQGRQFTAEAAAALVALHERGELEPGAERESVLS